MYAIESVSIIPAACPAIRPTSIIIRAICGSIDGGTRWRCTSTTLWTHTLLLYDRINCIYMYIVNYINNGVWSERSHDWQKKCFSNKADELNCNKSKAFTCSLRQHNSSVRGDTVPICISIYVFWGSRKTQRRKATNGSDRFNNGINK